MTRGPSKPSPRWEAMLPSVPWERRRRALQGLFEAIAPTYDRLNHLLSLGLDRGWRRRAAREAVSAAETGWALDLASGTGDLAVALAGRAPGLRVARLDLSAALLRRGDPKMAPSRSAPGLVAEMESIPLRRGCAAAVTMGFALRHVESLDALMRACAQVLHPGGRVAFVDMAIPKLGTWGRLYRIYFVRCLPRLAGLFGGDRQAYDLMVRSVQEFPGWDALETAAVRAGFVDTESIRLAGGAARIFRAILPPPGRGADRSAARLAEGESFP